MPHSRMRVEVECEEVDVYVRALKLPEIRN